MAEQEFDSDVRNEDISEEGMRERRYLWMARTFALIAVVSLLSTFMLIGALYSLLPIVRVQPFYLTSLSKEQQVINVVRPNFQQLDMKALTQSFIRQYLLARLSIGSNIAEMERRWGPDGIVYWMSESVVYKEFGTYAERALKQARSDGLTRNVNILNIVPFRTGTKGQNVWRAEVEFTDMKYGETEPVRSRYVITMNVTFRAIRKGLTWERRLKNPLGFMVLMFGIRKQD